MGLHYLMVLFEKVEALCLGAIKKSINLSLMLFLTFTTTILKLLVQRYA